MNGHELTFQAPMSASTVIVSAKPSDGVLLMDGMGTLPNEFDPLRIPKWLANMPRTPATQQYLLRQINNTLVCRDALRILREKGHV